MPSIDNTGITARPSPRLPSGSAVRHYLAVFGPGLVVMLADTDVGSVITAGQSGAQWGYRLLLLQLLLVPILYVVQEMTVRLAVYTGRGHGELIRQSFGALWAWVSVAGLTIAVMGALVTELSGVVGVGELYGVPRWASLALAVAVLLGVVLSGSYRRVERVAIALGLFELAFFVVAWWAQPGLGEMAHGAIDIPWANKDYAYLAAANIGAVIMPWMVFYQQSAVAEKHLGPEHLRACRTDTAIGALLTQLVMAAVLVAAAATIGQNRGAAPDAGLNTVGDLANALTPFLGVGAGKLVFSMGILGAGMVASIVVTLALAWGVGEVAGYKRSLELRPLDARWFYGVYALGVLACAVLVLFWPDLVALNVGVQIMNALLLPVVLGFLVALARRALPPSVRLRGVYYAVVLALVILTTALGVFGALSGAGLV
jgi:NRAMP (natural resistance-associated macrophage protein)-like metal ion transporter